MIEFGVVSALVLACLPIVVLLYLAACEERPAWLFALYVPAALALDLLLVALLARFVVLDVAAWVARGVWLAGGIGVYGLRRRGNRKSHWPREIDRALLVRALGLGLMGVLVSLTLSRTCAIWDRQWHIPFVTSLRGETMPFVGVYEPWRTLYYHWGGHVFAADLQTFSFGILHASHALSLAHDFYFFWFGVCIALVGHSLGLRRGGLVLLVFAAMLLSGPITMFFGGAVRPARGYSLPSFLNTSYRPHASLAPLLMLPFVALPLCRLREVGRELPPRTVLFPLAACVPALYVTDEFSLVLLFVALGVAWMFEPRLLAQTRRQGMVALLALAGILVASMLMLIGTQGVGAPSYPFELTAPASPGFYTEALPLSNPEGVLYFFSDLLPILATALAGALLMGRRDPLRTSWTTYVALSLLAIVLFACLRYGGSGLQNHRFLAAPMAFGPLFAAAWLVPRDASRPSVASAPALFLLVILGLAAASTFEWLAGGLAQEHCIKGQGFPGTNLFYGTNCREETGATTFSGRTRAVYAETSSFYLYAGCRPVFTPGQDASQDGHDQKAGWPKRGGAALAALHYDRRFLDPKEDLTVVCSTTPQASNRSCAYLRERGRCQRAGSMIELCRMSPEDRVSVLMTYRPTTAAAGAP